MASKVLFAKLMKKKYEKKRKRIEDFISKFRDENCVKLKDMKNYSTELLVEDLEEFCYNNQDTMTTDELSKLITAIDKIKFIYNIV